MRRRVLALVMRTPEGVDSTVVADAMRTTQASASSTLRRLFFQGAINRWPDVRRPVGAPGFLYTPRV
jgi:predicted transcriptional regulator